MPLPAFSDSVNVSINTSAVAGTDLKAVFDVTANTPHLNQLNINNFSAPQSTLGQPETTGGLVDGDIILGLNPAPFTYIDTGSFFNELIVNLTPVANSITFNLSYSENAPSSGTAPDEISFFLFNSSYQPLFSTSDPLGTDSLFAIDLNGAATSTDIYSPAAQTSPGNIQITVPGSVATTPEPTTLLMMVTAATMFTLWRWRIKRGN
jgi:hypothetical protein